MRLDCGPQVGVEALLLVPVTKQAEQWQRAPVLRAPDDPGPPVEGRRRPPAAPLRVEDVGPDIERERGAEAEQRVPREQSPGQDRVPVREVAARHAEFKSRKNHEHRCIRADAPDRPSDVGVPLEDRRDAEEEHD